MPWTGQWLVAASPPACLIKDVLTSAQEIDLVKTGNLPALSGMNHVTVSGPYAYACAADFRSNALIIAEITAKGALEQLSVLPLAGTITQAVVKGQDAYVCSQSGGLHLVDVSNPRQPAWLKKCEGPQHPLRAAVADSLLYIAVDTSLVILDIQNPAEPTSARVPPPSVLSRVPFMWRSPKTGLKFLLYPAGGAQTLVRQFLDLRRQGNLLPELPLCCGKRRALCSGGSHTP